MTANWEFLDDMTVAKAKQVVDDARAGRPIQSTRGPVVRSFADAEQRSQASMTSSPLTVTTATIAFSPGSGSHKRTVTPNAARTPNVRPPSE